ncbi:MAG: cation diffusion facilitator family transporter [Lentimicrobium sp.]|jgi:cation diffusion facilitator family transporter|nr:cation diffusion facilitator family transporter [Lentimicrobium sp.]
MAHKHISIYGALVANIAIAVMKFVAAAFTGSSAMLSEGIHSSVDSINQLLLLFGIHRSAKPANLSHPFGHGKEIYFWSLIVSILIFGLGGGMSIYEGIKHIQHPEKLTNINWNYAVLGGAFLFEGVSFIIAIRSLNKEKNVRGTFFQRVHISKDPSHFVVIYEDGAALGGLLIAGIGVFIGSHFNLPVADGIASIVIGLLLAFVAVLLTIESRDLLLGESMQSYEVDNIMKIVKQEKNVVDLLRPLSMHMSPNDILLALDVQFNPAINSTELLKTIKRLENSIQKVYPAIKRIYVEATNLTEEVPKSDLE